MKSSLITGATVLSATGVSSASVVIGSLNSTVPLTLEPLSLPSAPHADVNGDGLTDLVFNYSGIMFPGTTMHAAVGAPGGGILASGNHWTALNTDYALARALLPGEVVGPAGVYDGQSDLAGAFIESGGKNNDPYAVFYGAWADGTLQVAGFRFADSGGGMHYGWFSAYMAGPADPNASVADALQLVDFGYETEVGVGITVPAPGALGVLALGAAGLVRRTRARNHAA